MYFLNEAHRLNYENVTSEIYPNAKNDPEYHAMAYIQSLPFIYELCVEDKFFMENPFLWTVKYKDVSYTDQVDGEQITVVDYEVEENEDGEEVRSKDYYTLPTSYQQLIDLAMNLYNPSLGDFNLAASLNVWDDSLVKV